MSKENENKKKFDGKFPNCPKLQKAWDLNRQTDKLREQIFLNKI